MLLLLLGSVSLLLEVTWSDKEEQELMTAGIDDCCCCRTEVTQYMTCNIELNVFLKLLEIIAICPQTVLYSFLSWALLHCHIMSPCRSLSVQSSTGITILWICPYQGLWHLTRLIFFFDNQLFAVLWIMSVLLCELTFLLHRMQNLLGLSLPEINSVSLWVINGLRW